MKKRLITLFLLFALLVFVAGIGTFAWFTGTFETTDNSISSNGIALYVNMYGNPDYNEDGMSDSTTITMKNLMPSANRVYDIPGFQVFNKSEEAIKLKLEFIPGASITQDGAEAPSLWDVLLFTGKVRYVYDQDENGEYISKDLIIDKELPYEELLKTINVFINETGTIVDDEGSEGLKPYNENIMFELYARLPETAGNQYQGVTSTFSVRITGTQIENPGWTE